MSGYKATTLAPFPVISEQHDRQNSKGPQKCLASGVYTLIPITLTNRSISIAVKEFCKYNGAKSTDHKTKRNPDTSALSTKILKLCKSEIK